MTEAGRILGAEVGSTAPLFLAVLAIHVPAGITAVITGAGAALTRKGSARHIRLGRWYYGAITLVFITAAILAALRWREDWDLLLLGTLAYTSATIGFLHRRRHRPGDKGHILGMGASLAVMLTAFYVDNGPHFPLWDHLPAWAFWVLPGAVAAPLTTRALRNARARKETAQRSTDVYSRHSHSSKTQAE